MPRVLVWRATRIARRSASERRSRLQTDLAAFTTHADQLDLLATLDRYPDSQTEELRSMLFDVAQSDRRRGSYHAPRPARGSRFS